jgi:hypothetical protein
MSKTRKIESLVHKVQKLVAAGYGCPQGTSLTPPSAITFAAEILPDGQTAPTETRAVSLSQKFAVSTLTRLPEKGGHCIALHVHAVSKDETQNGPIPSNLAKEIKVYLRNRFGSTLGVLADDAGLEYQGEPYGQKPKDFMTNVPEAGKVFVKQIYSSGKNGIVYYDIYLLFNEEDLSRLSGAATQAEASLPHRPPSFADSLKPRGIREIA